MAYLPTLEIQGQEDPVVQVVDESNDKIVYTLRIKGTSFRPKVFAKSTYTIKVGEGNNVTILRGVKSIDAAKTETLNVAF